MRLSKVFAAAVLAVSMFALTACGEAKVSVTPVHGTISGTTYTNDSVGLKIEAPETWTLLGDADLTAYAGVDLSTVSDFKAYIEEKQAVIDAFMFAENGADNVNVAIEKKNSVTKLLNAQKYAEAAPETLKNALEQAGLSDVNVTVSSVKTNGGELPGCRTTATLNGMNVYQANGIYSIGDYFVTITATSYDENTCDSYFEYVTVTK